jgi:hypothetical protein
MRIWKCAVTALALAGSLCLVSAVAQDKKVNGKKPANGTPKAKVPAGPTVPSEAVPSDAPIAEPGLLPGAPPGEIPSLEYNYYYPPPGTAEVPQVPAQLYLCPSPYPPPYVGYTWISYPPFQPHEWLWIHRRAYYRLHPDGGATLTTIRWEYRDDH